MRASGLPPFDLTRSENGLLASLTPAFRIQEFLDTQLLYDTKGGKVRSPRRVLRDGLCQCMDGALFAAAALRVQGRPPLILDLEADQDDDHVLAVFKGEHGWGAIGRSNYSGLRFREPVYRSIRELVMTYFESYFNLRREKSLRAYSRPVNLARFDRLRWMTSEEDLWEIPTHLVQVPHARIAPPAAIKTYSRVDLRLFDAGLVGRR
ncbi:MAG: hypothetical protein JJE39_16090 [Vicinamibacteria bacterium]|nr:hypothetical protein [Vicinamibacteria bacterium]